MYRNIKHLNLKVPFYIKALKHKNVFFPSMWPKKITLQLMTKKAGQATPTSGPSHTHNVFRPCSHARGKAGGDTSDLLSFCCVRRVAFPFNTFLSALE